MKKAPRYANSAEASTKERLERSKMPPEPNTEPEEWRAIPGFEDYEVSSLGRVRRARVRACKLSFEVVEQCRELYKQGIGHYRLAKRFGVTKRAMRKALAGPPVRESLRVPNRVLRSQEVHGYPRVSLSSKGKVRHRGVHLLVASAFLGPIPSGMHVHHKNGIRNDNRVPNLEIVTPAENARQVWLMRKRPSLTPVDVQAIRNLHSEGVSKAVIARSFGIDYAHVERIVLRQAWAFLKEATGRDTT